MGLNDQWKKMDMHCATNCGIEVNKINVAGRGKAKRKKSFCFA